MRRITSIELARERVCVNLVIVVGFFSCGSFTPTDPYLLFSFLMIQWDILFVLSFRKWLSVSLSKYDDFYNSAQHPFPEINDSEKNPSEI